MRGAIVLDARSTKSAFTAFDRLSRALVMRAAREIERGRLTVIDPLGRHEYGAASDALPLDVVLRVHDLGLYSDALLRGTLGVGESYVRGDWTSSDLVGLVRLFIHDPRVTDRLDGRVARLSQPMARAVHALRRNTKRGSRRNIAAHYDLGNEFYATFLDSTLSYSAAIFERPTATLEEASIFKLERVCRKLDLRPEDHLLEIGTGWGALAMHAASRFGCRVTTTTLSREQHALAARRVADAGLADRVQVLLSDYRQLEGRFDKIVSIEMVEAVGYQYYDTFFSCLSEHLKRDGLALIQSITIADQRYQATKDAIDFIKAYVFPGSCIPSVTALLASATRASDLRAVHLEDITAHYARTLQVWRERFLAARERVLALGFDDRFVRLWEFYLAYCEAGFRERYIGDVQLLLARPGRRALPSFPALPAEPP